MKKKINISFIWIALIAVLMTAGGITFACYSLFQRQIQQDLKIDAEILSESNFFENNKSNESTKIFNDLHSEKIRITWIDRDGTVIFDNDANTVGLDNHIDRPEIQDAIKNGHGECIRKSDTFNMNTYYYALKLDDGTILRVSKDAQTILSVFFTILPLIIIIILLISLVCILISRLLTKQLIEPLDHMAEQLDKRMDIPKYKELIPFANKIQTQHENILASAKSRQDFTANVTHELKTPLTAISGYAELIENNMIDDSQFPYIASQIRDNSSRLLYLINDIIRLSELDHKELERDFEEIDLLQLAKDVCKDLMVSAHKKKITLYCLGEDLTIRADAYLIQELISNLVHNAIQYTNDNGKIEVIVKRENNVPVLIVKDNGIGISTEDQTRIFERFYRVDKSRSRQTGGTGLGLAIVKHIVEIHDAKIEISSEVNKGTEIKILF